MKYHQIIAALQEEPLLLTPGAHASLAKLFEDHRQFDKGVFDAKREGVDFCGQEIDLDQMEVIDGIAHIPIGGPIGIGLGKFEKGAGAVDVGDIEDDLDNAEDDHHCEGAILIIDSPGGMVSGTPELADRIARFSKPIYAFSSGMICSAAYWLACACDKIYATKSADIGSIGVYCPFLDYSERYKAAGVKVQVISSGKYKGAGVPGTSLSTDQLENMQERINQTARMFYDHVMEHRPDANLDDMQGQVFKAQEAANRGLIDAVVANLDEAIADIPI